MTPGSCGNNGATALLMRQSNATDHPSGRLVSRTISLCILPLIRQSPGTETCSCEQVFEWPEWITVRGQRVAHGGQELGIAPLVSADGAVSLILATPAGRHIFWDASEIGARSAEPPLQPPPLA